MCSPFTFSMCIVCHLRSLDTNGLVSGVISDSGTSSCLMHLRQPHNVRYFVLRPLAPTPLTTRALVDTDHDHEDHTFPR